MIRPLSIFFRKQGAHSSLSYFVVLHFSPFKSLGDLEVARKHLTQSLSFPQCTSTALAHHELALVSSNKKDAHERNLHFQKALDMGMDPTPQAIEALGERNPSVMRASNRQHYNSLNSGSVDQTSTEQTVGVIDHKRRSQPESVIAPGTKEEEAPAQSDTSAPVFASGTKDETLTLLAQGAKTYDGHTPKGGEVGGTESTLSSLNVKKQHGSESNLSNLRRVI